MQPKRHVTGAALLVALLAACSGATTTARVDGARMIGADREPGNWPSHGRTYSEQRFSPLARLTTANVGGLGLAWSHDIRSRTARGLEATPIVVDGVLYTSGAWSHVLALDARTGALLWEFDPEVPGHYSSLLGAAPTWKEIVLDGTRVRNGMVSFSRYLKPDDVETIRAYVIQRAHDEQKRRAAAGR